MSSQDDATNYLKIDDAARMLGVSRRWVYRRIWKDELPAAKVGGLYFIQREDLQRLMEKRRASPTTDSEGMLPVEKCGYCFRLLTSDALVGEVCQAEGCEKLVCTQCLAEGIRHCAQHIPSREQKISDLEARYQRGELPTLVKASTARLLEMNFINRIQARIGGMTNLMHPLTGELLTVTDWNAILEASDERAEMMRLLGKVVLDTDTLARQPLNAALHYRLPPEKRQKGPPVEIWVRTLSRLPEMLRDGCDTRPLDGQDLLPLLAQLSEEAQHSPVFRLVVFASTTGWHASARQIVQGETIGSAFVHRLLLIYLFDLAKGELIYNQRDEQARRFAELFAPLLPSEELVEAMEAVRKELIAFESLTLQFASQTMPYPKELLKQAFEKLAATGRYAITDAPNLGMAIIKH